MTTKASRNKLLQNIKDSYKTATLAITIVTNATDRMNYSKKPPTTNRNTQNSLRHAKTQQRVWQVVPAAQSQHPPQQTTTNRTSYSTVSINSTQRPNRETEIPEHKALNSAIVPMNKASSTTWKLSENHALPHT